MNKTIPYLKTAKAENNYKLYVLYDGGVDGIIDLENWKGKGVFKIWDHENNFKNFKITDDKKIEWTEDIDMDPDAFYLKLINKAYEKFQNS